MSITVEISERRRSGEPSFATPNNLARFVAVVGELQRCFSVLLFSEPDDGCTSPISYDDVHQSIFVKIARHTAHRSHHGCVKQTACVQRKGFVSHWGAWRWSHCHAISSRIDVTNIV